MALDSECQTGAPSDAIVAPQVVYVQGYETEGQLYRVPKDEPGTNISPDGLSLTSHGGLIEGDFAWHGSGGRENGGYATSVSAPWIDRFGNPHWLGQYCAIALAPGETPPTQGGIHKAFNLFGQTLTGPMRCLGFGSDTGSGKFYPSIFLQINPDRTFQVMRTGFTGSGALVLTRLGAVSSAVVPATGWFAFEFTRGGAGGNPFGGFSQVNLHTDSTPPAGIPAIRAIGVDTGELAIHGYAWGTDVVSGDIGTHSIPNLGVGFDGIGLDDGLIYRNGGTVKRFAGNTFVGAAIPSAPGDSTGSQIASDTRTPYQSNPSAPIVTLGASVVHGSTDRWRNVTGTPMRPRDELLQRFGVITFAGDSPFGISLSYGRISIFTSNWLAGPYDPPRYDNQFQTNPDPPVGDAFDLAAENAMTRNTFYDEDLDLYRPAITRSDIIIVEGIFPYARLGARWLSAIVEGGDIFGAADAFASMVSRRTFNTEGDVPHRYACHVIKVGGVVQAGAPFLANNGFNGANYLSDTPSGNPFLDARLWKPRPGYVLGQFIADNPATLTRFRPDELPLTQIGLRGDLTAANEQLTDPAHRWVQIDCCELGFEFAYHKTSAPETEHPAFPPVAGVAVYLDEFHPADSSDLPNGKVVAYDVSLDWDGTIVTRTIDWGDGSPVETFAGGGIANRRTHIYATPGVKTLTSTATDNDGLTNTRTLAVAIPAPVPTAQFTLAQNPDDADGLTVDFTDTSTTPTDPFANTITGWLWQFGDGTTSTEQHPTHAYATAGEYTVSLTVTTNLGETSETSGPVTLPFTVSQSVEDGLGDVPYLQGDALNGDNLPLPDYANTAAYDDEYFAGTRGFYSISYASDDGDHTLVVKDGKKAIEMLFGGGFFGAGWWTDLTDDNPVSENYVPSPAQWVRFVWQAEAGVASDPSLNSHATGTDAPHNQQGLTVFRLSGRNVSIGVFIRDGHVMLDVSHQTTTDGFPVTESYDLGLETAFVGAGGWGDLILRHDGDWSAKTLRVRAWKGALGTLAGAAPIHDVTIPAFGDSSGLGLLRQLTVESIDWLNYTFTPGGTPRKLWWCYAKTVPASAIANPWNVGLSGGGGGGPSLAAAQGSYVLTGQSAGLAVSGDRMLSASAGAYAITGQTVALVVDTAPPVGVLRFDDWSPGQTADSGEQITNLLTIPEYTVRWPRFVNASGPTMDEGLQALMDEDLQLLHDAGIKFVTFQPFQTANRYGINNYLASPNKGLLKFALNQFKLGTFNVADGLEKMADSQYLKFGGRPVVFFQMFNMRLFATPTDLADYRAAIVAAGFPNPYFVGQENDPTQLAATMAAWDLDAGSWYVGGLTGLTPGVRSDFTAQTAAEESEWATVLASGRKMVPVVTPGFDNRTYTPSGSALYTTEPTATPLAAHMTAALDFVAAHPSACESRFVLVVAWNEYTEGHALAPRYVSGNPSGDPALLNAIGAAIAAWTP